MAGWFLLVWFVLDKENSAYFLLSSQSFTKQTGLYTTYSLLLGSLQLPREILAGREPLVWQHLSCPVLLCFPLYILSYAWRPEIAAFFLMQTPVFGSPSHPMLPFLLFRLCWGHDILAHKYIVEQILDTDFIFSSVKASYIQPQTFLHFLLSKPIPTHTHHSLLHFSEIRVIGLFGCCCFG